MPETPILREPRPDLENPMLPDAGELEWAAARDAEREAGDNPPSGPAISPFGAKAAAAMTGALATSLLSEFFSNHAPADAQ